MAYYPSDEMQQRLNRLSDITEQAPTQIITEAIERYIAEEEREIGLIKDGLREAEAENFATSEEVKETFKKWLKDAN